MPAAAPKRAATSLVPKAKPQPRADTSEGECDENK